MSEMKNCLRCGTRHPLTNFHKDRSKPDGRRPYCRPCVNAEMRDRRNERIARGTHSRPEVKTCPDCHETKPAADYSPDLGRPDGLAGMCRPCSAARFRARYAAQKEGWR